MSTNVKKNGMKFGTKSSGKSTKNSKPMPPKAAPKKILPPGWYYMVPEEITVSEIRDVLDPKEYNIEIWTEVGVLEIGVAEKASLDVETCELDLGDEYSNEFLQENGVKSLFYMSFPAEQEARCTELMKKIVAARGGMICGDTDDFTPVIR